MLREHQLERHEERSRSQCGVGPSEALALYRDKDAIEKRFGGTEALPGFRTPGVSTERTLDGELPALFVALVVTAWPRKRMRETGLDGDYTLTGLLEEAGAIERYTKPRHRPRVLEVAAK